MTVKDYKHLLIIARDAPWRLNQRQLTKGLDSLCESSRQSLAIFGAA